MSNSNTSNQQCTWCKGSGTIQRAYAFSFAERSIIGTLIFIAGLGIAFLGLYTLRSTAFFLVGLTLGALGLLAANFLPDLFVILHSFGLLNKKIPCPHCNLVISK